MSSPPAVPTPDFNRMAANFDRFLPQVHPVSLAVLDRLPEPPAGSVVLDVACGTGEPGLTLARRSPGVRLLGVDSAPAMIEAARGKAARESLENVRFEVMASDALSLPDGSADSAVSRFGLLMFGDVPASARELARVLRPGGHFSLAVWDEMDRNTLVYKLTLALRKHLPEAHGSPLERLQEWAGEARRAEVLADAGFGAVHSEVFAWMYELDSFEGPWELLSRMGAMTGQAGLTAEAQEQVRSDVLESLSLYRQPSGGYRIPHACRLFWGQR